MSLPDEYSASEPLLPVDRSNIPGQLSKPKGSRARRAIACLLALMVVIVAWELLTSALFGDAVEEVTDLRKPDTTGARLESASIPALPSLPAPDIAEAVLPSSEASTILEGVNVEANSPESITAPPAPTASDLLSSSLLPPSPSSPPISSDDPVSSVKQLNVHPRPFPPPPLSSPPRYLAYESHSGFHNQRIALTNALTIAHILNRTLLLPPVRLGRAVPWSPAVETQLVRDERCKIDPKASPDCPNSETWTYVGWPYLLRHGLFDGRPLVDRWNSTPEWFEAPREEGGLGVTKGSVVNWDDPDRRSYQFYDMRETPSRLGAFINRIDLEDLKEGIYANKEVLHFGSLFSSARVILRDPELKKVKTDIEWGMILGNPVLEDVSNKAKHSLGVYRGVHLRIGDGPFVKKAEANMRTVFWALLRSLSIADERISSFFPTSSTRPHRRSELSVPRFTATSPPSSKSLSPSLSCSRPLYVDPDLLPLNAPLYIATDSHHPRTDPVLAMFFSTFPCTFVLEDVQGPLDAAESKLVSEWDGLHLTKFLIPFLDAEIAAKALTTLGTPGSTFSGYATGVLHKTLAHDDPKRLARRVLR